MSIRFIIGKSGSGKSYFYFNEIRNMLKEKNKIYIITPEQFSLTAEKKLMDTSNGAVINAEVLTFDRMAYRIMQEVGGSAKVQLSDCGKSMLIYNILDKNKKELKFLGKSEENIEIVNTQITELKKHNVSLKDLNNAIENTEDKYLQSKLLDIEKVYEEFTNSISEKFIDENDKLTMLANSLDKTEYFNNSVIYIDEFVGFTKQEYEVIRKLLRCAKQVTVTLCADNIDLSKGPELDIFYSNKETIHKLSNIAKEENIEIEKIVNLDTLYRFKNEELKALEQNLYLTKTSKYTKQTNNISLFLAKNQYSEIENVAQNIIKLVKEEKYRYNEISIITKNIETYSSIAKAIFNKYKIPLYIDEKKDLGQNILAKYILSIIEIYAQSWSFESVMSYLKSGFIDLDNDEIFEFQNYCLKWGIKGKKWYSNWDFKNETEENKLQIKRMKEIKNIVIEPLINLKNNLSEQKKFSNITKCLFDFIIENNIYEKLNEKIKKLNEIGELDLASEYATSWNVVIQVLDEINLVFKDDKVSLDKYFKILKIGLSSTGLGKIPMSQDEVILGDVDRSRTHRVKAIFIIGLNDGIFPKVNTDEGFLGDSDREYLKENGIELAKGTLERMYDDNFNTYKAFTTAEEKLFLSYSSSDSEGKALRPSILIMKIKKIFPNIIQKSDVINRNSEIITKDTTFDELIIKMQEYVSGKEIEEIWFDLYNYYINDDNYKDKLISAMEAIEYTNNAQTINTENIEKLYGNTMRTSVSKLEQYRSCPFSYFLKYGLKLNEKDNFKIKPMDTGNFMHEVIDEFFEKIRENNIDIKSDENAEEIDTIIEEIIDEKLLLSKNYIFTSTPKFKNLTNRLKKVIKMSIGYIIESLKNSDFTILGNEVEFGTGKKYNPIVIELDNNKKVEIIGKIDRIDVAQNSDGKYIRIIDYKSSVKDIDLNEVVAGLQLQLLTYLGAACEIEDVLPAGVLYFNLIEPSINAKVTDDTQIIDELRKNYKMKGLILADMKVIKMMDKTLETGASKIIPVYIKKEGEISSSKSSTINKTQFENLQKYINKLIKQISKEIYSGNISIKPYYNSKNKKTPCEYCSYKSICNFNNNACKKEYNYIAKLDKEYIMEMIKDRNE